jgi:hypothetical protein
MWLIEGEARLAELLWQLRLTQQLKRQYSVSPGHTRHFSDLVCPSGRSIDPAGELTGGLDDSVWWL